MTTPIIAYAVKVRSVASGGWYWLSSAGDMGCHHGYRMLVSSREHALREASLRGYSRDNIRLVRVRERAASEVVSLAHHMASVATARLAALEEAERACSVVAELKRKNFGTASSSMDAARDCVDAIAALRAPPPFVPLGGTVTITRGTQHTLGVFDVER